MSDVVSPLLQWLNSHPELSGLVTFVISAGESVAIVGTVVPGSIMMTALGVLAGSGVIPLIPTLIWAILGAIVGDGISYWAGYYFKDRLPTLWPFRKYPNLLKKGDAFFKKHGSMSVFIGRFVGPVRALVPLVAGMLGMRPLQFTIANVTSAIGWAPVYMLPGILLGAASLELPADIAVHVLLVLCLLTLFLMLCLWFIFKLYQLIQTRISHAQDAIWQYLKKSPRLSPITQLLKDHDPAQTHGQLNLAFYFVFIGLLFLALAFYVKLVSASTIIPNQVVFHFFRGIRVNYLNNDMLNITLLAQKQIILPVLVTLFIWLLYCKRIRTALHIFVLGIFAAGSVFTIKNILRSPRPWGITHSPETYSMPSGHAILSVSIYLTLVYLISQSLSPKYRRILYGLTLLFILIIGISRLYLGAHWLTDIIAGWLVGAAILIFILISYRRQPETPVSPTGIILVTMITLAVTYSSFCYLRYNTLVHDYTPLPWPTKAVEMQAWWQNDDLLWMNHTNIFGFQSQAINIEWVGDINQIRKTLTLSGWSKPPSRDWISTMHRLADVRSAQYLPMISPQYLDKKPELTLTQAVPGERGLIIIRLWDAHCQVAPQKLPLWAGTIGFVPTTYSWLYSKENRKQHATEFSAFARLFALQTQSYGWTQKTMSILLKSRRNQKKFERAIVLIRPTSISH